MAIGKKKNKLPKKERRNERERENIHVCFVCRAAHISECFLAEQSLKLEPVRREEVNVLTGRVIGKCSCLWEMYAPEMNRCCGRFRKVFYRLPTLLRATVSCAFILFAYLCEQNDYVLTSIGIVWG